MPTGTVKWFDPTKRFGFITDESGVDVYVHVTALTSERVRAGDVVEFRTEEDDRGPQAVDVTVVREAAGPEERPSGKEDLLGHVEAAIRKLEAVAAVLRQGRPVGADAAFYAARDIRRLASRLNPPAA